MRSTLVSTTRSKTLKALKNRINATSTKLVEPINADKLDEIYAITDAFITQYQDEIEQYQEQLPIDYLNRIADFYYDRAVMCLPRHIGTFTSIEEFKEKFVPLLTSETKDRILDDYKRSIKLYRINSEIAIVRKHVETFNADTKDTISKIISSMNEYYKDERASLLTPLNKYLEDTVGIYLSSQPPEQKFETTSSTSSAADASQVIESSSSSISNSSSSSSSSSQQHEGNSFSSINPEDENESSRLSDAVDLDSSSSSSDASDLLDISSQTARLCEQIFDAEDLSQAKTIAASSLALGLNKSILDTATKLYGSNESRVCEGKAEDVYNIINEFINSHGRQINKFKDYLSSYSLSYLADFYYDRADRTLSRYIGKFTCVEEFEAQFVPLLTSKTKEKIISDYSESIKFYKLASKIPDDSEIIAVRMKIDSFNADTKNIISSIILSIEQHYENERTSCFTQLKNKYSEPSVEIYLPLNEHSVAASSVLESSSSSSSSQQSKGHSLSALIDAALDADADSDEDISSPDEYIQASTQSTRSSRLSSKRPSQSDDQKPSQVRD